MSSKKLNYDKSPSRRSKLQVKWSREWRDFAEDQEDKLRTDPDYAQKRLRSKLAAFKVGDFEFDCIGRSFEKAIIFYCQLKRYEFEFGVPREIRLDSPWDGFHRVFICERLENDRFKITVVREPQKVREQKPDGRRQNPGAPPKPRALPRVTFNSPKWQYTLCLMVTAHIPDYRRWRTKSGDPLPGIGDFQ